MLISLVGLLAIMAQAEPDSTLKKSEDVALETLTTAPQTFKPSSKCACKEEDVASLIIEGLVIDAELTLAPDRRSTNDRRATIFNVIVNNEADIKGRTKVWHVSNPDQCGVSFDYGKKYKIALRKTEEGQLETDACLMKELAE